MTEIDLKLLSEGVRKDGVFLVRHMLSADFIHELKRDLERAIESETAFHGGTDYQDYGMVLCCSQYGGAFLKLFDTAALMEPFNLLLGNRSIVYSDTSTSMPPGRSNFSSRIHRDAREACSEHLTKIMALILLDDFTQENGATWFLRGSHKMENPPSADEFFQDAEQLLAPAGSVLFWHPSVFHAGGVNNTKSWRHALTLVMCRPEMKQRLDLPRLLKKTLDIRKLTVGAQQKLGLYVQVPASYEEYYAPPDSRPYKET